MEEDNYSQQELFEQRKYISDLIEEKTEKKKSSLNAVSYTHLTLPTT